MAPTLPRRLTAGGPLLLALGPLLLVYLWIVATGFDGRHYLRGDCPYYFLTAVSLLQDGDLDLGNQLRESADLQRHSADVSLDRFGRLVPKHPLVLPLLALPLIAALGAPGALLFNLLQLAALLYVLFALARRAAGPWAAAAAVALTGVATFLPQYAWNFSPDLLATLLLAGGLVALPAGRGAAPLRHLLAGALFGLALVAKLPYAVALPGALALVGSPWRRTLPPLAAGLALPLALLALLNLHLFGSPATTAYDRIAVFEHGGVRAYSQRGDFDLPLRAGLAGQLFDREHGLLPTTPITLVSLAALPLLARRHRRLAFAVAFASAALLLLFSRYQLWYTSEYGNRFLMPLVALAALPLAALCEWAADKLRRRPAA
jgi:hypothetical protein